MVNNLSDKDERYPLDGSTDLIDSLAPILELLGNYDESKHETRMHFLGSLGRPAIKEIIRRFEQVLSFGCDHKLDYFKLPQTRTQDHYIKGELLWYLKDSTKVENGTPYLTDKVRKIDSYYVDYPDSDEDRKLYFQGQYRHDLHVFFERGDIIPLRSIRTLSKKEFMLIYQEKLLPILEKALPVSEQKYLECMGESFKFWIFEQKKTEVKSLVKILTKRQEDINTSTPQK